VSRASSALSTETQYLAFISSGLGYGPRFRTCTDPVVTPHLAMAAVKYATASESWERQSFNHPGILDGSLHSLINVQRAPHDHGHTCTPRLPFTISRLYLSARRAENVFVNASNTPGTTSRDDLDLFCGAQRSVRLEGL
jgi:hypothetical protein